MTSTNIRDSKNLYDSVYYINIRNKNNISKVKLYLKLLGYKKTHKINSQTRSILVNYDEIVALKSSITNPNIIHTNDENFISHYKPDLIIPERIEKLKSIL